MIISNVNMFPKVRDACFYITSNINIKYMSQQYHVVIMFRIKLNMELPGVIPDIIKLISPLHIVWNHDHCDMIKVLY